MALVLFWVIAGEVFPGADCEGSDVASGVEQTFMLVLTCIVGLGCLAGAGVLLRRRGIPRWRPPMILVGVVVLGLVIAMVLLPTPWILLWPLMIGGLVATGGAALVLLALVLAGSGIEETGYLVAGYLIGLGLFVFPALFLVHMFFNSGIAC